jgi:4-diphosphocytidyl-2-C-methyl-D-erythritol kinase
VSASLVEKAAAKINLTLRVLGRREDGYHRLESLVAFAELADTLSLQPGAATTLAVLGPFAAACGPAADNLILKAAAALRERVAGLKAGRFVLEKNIPVAAGLGGGSADAAAALRLLARANGLAPTDPRLAAAALAVGADVPVCLASQARIMRGVGDELSAPLDLPPLEALLVNPGVALATRAVFAKFAGDRQSQKALANLPRERDALIEWLGDYGNDLTPSAIACAPVIADVLAALCALPDARLVRMSGSGPTCFALFGSTGEAAAAAQRLRAERKEWWICPATIGQVQRRP